MQVRTIIGATAAYACIQTPETSLDVQLAPGKSAAAALREWAQDQQAAAERLTRRAALALAAADQLEPRA